MLRRDTKIRYHDFVLHFLVYVRRAMGVCDFECVRQHQFRYRSMCLLRSRKIQCRLCRWMGGDMFELQCWKVCRHKRNIGMFSVRFGNYTFEKGKSKCDVCPTGTYSELKKGSSTCRNCTAGTYTSSSEQSICSLCSAGTYTSTQGKSLCEVCPQGRFSVLTRGSTICVECTPGTFSSNRSATCSSCPRGRYSTHNASTVCEICTSGHYTGGLDEGSSVCLKCDPGTTPKLSFSISRFVSSYTLLHHPQPKQVHIHPQTLQ